MARTFRFFVTFTSILNAASALWGPRIRRCSCSVSSHIVALARLLQSACKRAARVRVELYMTTLRRGQARGRQAPFTPPSSCARRSARPAGWHKYGPAGWGAQRTLTAVEAAAQAAFGMGAIQDIVGLKGRTIASSTLHSLLMEGSAPYKVREQDKEEVRAALSRDTFSR